MEFNNGNERRKLNKKWERLRVQYQQAGMSEDAIQAMYDFDLGVLNSERSYVANTLAIVDDGDDSTGRKSSDFKQYEKAICCNRYLPRDPDSVCMGRRNQRQAFARRVRKTLR